MDKFEFKVPGTEFTLRSNTIYRVIPKVDPDAPDGFVKHKTTKVIHPAVTTSVGCPYDVTMEAWDTGFYKASKCLRGLGDKEKEAMIEVFDKYLIKPVEAIKGEGALRHDKANKFYDSFRIPLGTTIYFDTKDPLERLKLYLAILGKNLAPKQFESHPNFKKAQFCVVNNEDAVSAKQEKDVEKTEAIGLFYTLLNSNQKKLYQILDYIGIVSSDKTDKSTLTTVFINYVEDPSKEGFKNGKIFIDTYKKFEGEKGENELYVYNLLKELNQKGLIKVVRGAIYLDDENLGNGFKLAATYAASNPQINQRLLELSENN